MARRNAALAGPDNESRPLADLALARRLERAEGAGSAGFVDTHARLNPETCARWIEVAGTWAMFDGVESPVTQTFGLGLFQPVRAADLDVIQAFFHERGAPVHHELCPLAGVAVADLLCARAYRPVEFSSVMHRPTRGGPAPMAPRNPAVRARLVGEHERELWARTTARGWSEGAEPEGMLLDLMRVAAGHAEGLPFLAELDGQPIAGGHMVVHDGVALLAGASTIPEARRQGAQAALLEARLRCAAERGCDVAMVCAEPGSASQRNAERQGFRIAYTRTKWRLDPPGPAAL